MADKFDDKRIQEALELLNEVARDKKAELQEMVAGKYTNFKSVIEGVGQKIQQESSQFYQRGREKVKEMATELDENVHQNPWPYIGGAALGALILGYFLGRTRK